jgi:hypothetical protein
MTSHQPNSPLPLTHLGTLPAAFATWLRERGVVTCEQAYELVLRLLASDPQPVLSAGVLPADLVRLRQQLETVIPERRRTALTEAAADHWTSQRPLGVLPPQEVETTPPDEPAPGEDQDQEH